MVSWKSSVSCTEKREEHMLSFTLETRSLICDAAIIRPSQYGQSVIRCNINKRDKKQRADLDGWAAFSVSGFSQAVMNFGGATKVSRVCLPHPKPKRWPNFMKKFQVGSRFGEGGVPEKGSSDILWQLTHTEHFCLFSFRCGTRTHFLR